MAAECRVGGCAEEPILVAAGLRSLVEREYIAVDIDKNVIIRSFVFVQYFHSVLCDKLYEIPTVVDNKDDNNKLLTENKFLFRPRVRQVFYK